MNLVEPVQTLGFVNFLAQTDTIARIVLAILLVMSLASWYFIVTKALQLLKVRRRSARFLAGFWESPSLEAVAARLEQHHPDEPFAHLAWHAIVAHRHYGARHAELAQSTLNEAGSSAEFLTRSMRRVIDEETARVESGLAVLASVGSTAPFIGLFGTVWGVYHALIAIGLSGQGTLDKVAGPVGEALIMTALGLAVAIPAVLGYNAFVRWNRIILAQLDSFAHDLYAVLTTGTHLGEAPAASSAAPAGAASAPSTAAAMPATLRTLSKGTA
jgi:biopolymer transport protein ExbB